MMGLDQYLYRKTYVQRWDHIAPEHQFSVIVERGGKTYAAIDPKKVAYITEQVAYWRKANQIHAWFVQNVQKGEDDCGVYYVEREKLEQLLKTCREVLAEHAKANELLPPQAGFFFGNTEIDRYYFDDLRRTVMQIEPLLDPKYDDASYEYHSSW
jgi:hypothetical protein